MSRGLLFLTAILGLGADAQARIMLKNDVDACACWTAEYVALEGIAVSGDLHLAFELGAITLSSGTSLRFQLRHTSSSGENGSGSKWLVPQLSNCLSRDAAGNLVWLSPKGMPIVLGERLSGIFTSPPDTELKARTAGDGRIEIRCPHGFTYRFRGYSLDEIETGTGETYRATTRGGLIEELCRIERSGTVTVVLAADYDRWMRLVGLAIQGRRHRLDYAPGSRHLVEWTDEGKGHAGIMIFQYNHAGLLSRIAGAIDRDFDWSVNPFAHAGATPWRGRWFRIEKDGDLRYEYSVAGKIVTLTAISPGGRRQKLYYNLGTRNMDLFDP